MKGMLKAIIVAALFGLAGCAGTDFVRPDANSFTNGQSTYAQVFARMGAPQREGTVLKNEKNIKTATYAYASVGGKPLHEGVTPARAMGFYFDGDRLNASGEGAVYAYVETTGSAFNMKFFRKVLIVTFDAAGVVEDVDFSSSGSR